MISSCSMYIYSIVLYISIYAALLCDRCIISVFGFVLIDLFRSRNYFSADIATCDIECVSQSTCAKRGSKKFFFRCGPVSPYRKVSLLSGSFLFLLYPQFPKLLSLKNRKIGDHASEALHFALLCNLTSIYFILNMRLMQMF